MRQSIQTYAERFLTDDLIDTGGTIVKAAEALMKDGAAGVVIAAQHGAHRGALERDGAAHPVGVAHGVGALHDRDVDGGLRGTRDRQVHGLAGLLRQLTHRLT